MMTTNKNLVAVSAEIYIKLYPQVFTNICSILMNWSVQSHVLGKLDGLFNIVKIGAEMWVEVEVRFTNLWCWTLSDR